MKYKIGKIKTTDEAGNEFDTKDKLLQWKQDNVKIRKTETKQSIYKINSDLEIVLDISEIIRCDIEII